MTKQTLASSGRRPVVSVVEDDRAMRAALIDLLDAAGCDPQAYSSGEEFLASAEALSSDIVITDIQLGDLDGLDLMNRLHQIAPKPPPVIVITAMTDDALQASATAQGCHAFLRKPFDPELLMTYVRQALGDPRG